MKNRVAKIAIVIAGVSLLVGGWYAWKTTHPKKEKPPALVEAMVVDEKETHVWTQFSGKLKAVDYVDIRPQVGGVVQEILFKEGSIVKKGDPLFTIDPRPFEAAVQQAEAELLSAKTNAELAEIQLHRGKTLEKTATVSKQEVDQRTTTLKVSQANIQAAEASLLKARLNLEYAHIKSPIDGRISRAEITVGNLVEAGVNAPTLTTVVSVSPIYAEFDIDENTYLEYAKKEGTESKAAEKLPVELVLGEETYKGTLQFTDNRLDPSTGTIRVRALFDNPSGKLLSGMFADIRVSPLKAVKAIILPDSVIQTDQTNKFVYVLDAKNQIAYRQIKLGRRSGDGFHIIKEGLKAGEKIVSKGGQNLRPGAIVSIEKESS